MPIEPPDTPLLRVPSEAMDVEGEILLDGGSLSPGWVLAGYRAGIFPMPHTCPPDEGGCSHLFWYSPVQRGLIPLDGFRMSRSLRAAVGRHSVRVDTAFEDVLV